MQGGAKAVNIYTIVWNFDAAPDQDLSFYAYLYDKNV
jgi:hypothetical protein